MNKVFIVFLFFTSLAMSTEKFTLESDLEILDMDSCQYTGEGKDARIHCDVLTVIPKGEEIIYTRTTFSKVPNTALFNLVRFITFKEYIYYESGKMNIGYVVDNDIPKMNLQYE